ncbi:MAG: DegT/DnrJ/EryC1/StrS family aminotransferase [Niabella sp.]
MKNKSTRKEFINKMGALSAGLTFGVPLIAGSKKYLKPAVLGGATNYKFEFPKWPIFGVPEQEGLTDVLNSGQWGRLAKNTKTEKFERSYEAITGAKHALALSSGTTALVSMLGALKIGPGDEVIIPPYTFIATYNAIAMHYALPVFVDTDIESFQIDARKIKHAITGNTKAIMPVHIGGSPFDVDKVLTIANQYNLPVIEDACQAHLAEWKGKCVGNWGIGGAFSFQASKNLNAGEGGAVISNNTDFYQNCVAFHHQGQSSNTAGLGTGAGTRGANFRLTEFQSTILLAQMTRLKVQSERRWENAQYLTNMLKEIPGIKPAKLYPGTTKSAFHLYMFRFNEKEFGTTRQKFIKALSAEGLVASSGYDKINKGSFVSNLAKDRHYLKIYGEKRMKQWLEQNRNTPANDRLTEEAVWFLQTTLLGTKSQMEQIVDVIKKIRNNVSKL